MGRFGLAEGADANRWPVTADICAERVAGSACDLHACRRMLCISIELWVALGWYILVKSCAAI